VPFWGGWDDAGTRPQETQVPVACERWCSDTRSRLSHNIDLFHPTNLKGYYIRLYTYAGSGGGGLPTKFVGNPYRLRDTIARLIHTLYDQISLAQAQLELSYRTHFLPFICARHARGLHNRARSGGAHHHRWSTPLNSSRKPIAINFQCSTTRRGIISQ